MAQRPSTFAEIAAAMFPNLSPEAKQREAQAQRIAQERERHRQVLLRGLRELNENLRIDKMRNRRT
jgi:hypothetical protein